MGELIPIPSSVCHFDILTLSLPTARFFRRPLQMPISERSVVISCRRGQLVRQVLMMGMICRMMRSVEEVSSSVAVKSKRLMY